MDGIYLYIICVSLCTDDLNADCLPVAYIIVKPFAAVVTETVIVSYHQILYLKTFFQYLSHEFFGGQTGDVGRKIKHQAIIYSRACEQVCFFFGSS